MIGKGYIELSEKPGNLFHQALKDNYEGKGIAVEDLTLDTSKPFEVFLSANGGFCTRIANSYNLVAIPSKQPK
jgi:hypothetical protein